MTSIHFAAAGFILLLTNTAMADSNSHVQNGAVCHVKGSATKGLYYSAYGITALASGGVEVICPLDRDFEVPDGYSYVVDLTGNENLSTISCTLTSYSYQGQYLGSASFQDSGRNLFGAELILPSTQVPYGLVQAVDCKMGPGVVLFELFSWV